MILIIPKNQKKKREEGKEVGEMIPVLWARLKRKEKSNIT